MRTACAHLLSAKSPKWQFSKRWDARTLRGRKEETCVTLVWDMKVQNAEIEIIVIL
jgi:hypothetical protein